MINAPIPANEQDRLASLKRMQLLYTPDEEAFDRITRVTKQIFNVPVAFISLVAEDYQWFKSRIGTDRDKTPRDLSICGHVISEGVMLVLEDAQQDWRFTDNALVCTTLDIRFYAGRPLINSEGFVIGTLCVIDHKPRLFTAEERETLDAIGYWVEAVFAARGLSQAMDGLLLDLDEARRDSMMDSLLHIWNRGAIADIMKREASYAKRQGTTLSVLMVDIDLFKDINDTYGHHVGDITLLEVVKILRHQLRSYDALGRYGGEEFLIALPNTVRAEALKLAERLRSEVEKATIAADGLELHCSISIGLAIADYTVASPDIEQTIISVDRALRQAKSAGRNRVEVAA